ATERRTNQTTYIPTKSRVATPALNSTITNPQAPPTYPFFFNNTATTQIYTLSLHDALPISTTNWPATAATAQPFDPFDPFGPWPIPSRRNRRDTGSCTASRIVAARTRKGAIRSNTCDGVRRSRNAPRIPPASDGHRSRSAHRL